MTIVIPRPEDPELAKLWGEAKRNVEQRDEDCCVGDRERCRCAMQVVRLDVAVDDPEDDR